MLTRISGQAFVLNCDLIERVDITPDTVISMVDGRKYVVQESPRDVVAAVRLYRSEVIALSHHLPAEGLLPQPAGSHDDDEDAAHGAHASAVVSLHSAPSVRGS